MESKVSKKKTGSTNNPVKRTIKKVVFWLKHFEPSKLQSKISKSVYLAILFVIVIIASFQVGYIRGTKKGSDLANSKKNNTVSGHLPGLFDSPINSPRTITGKVRAVSNSKIEIDSSRGKTVSLAVTSNTKVTRKKDVLTMKDISKDQRVTIFTSGNQDSLTATRLVLSSAN